MRNSVVCGEACQNRRVGWSYSLVGIPLGCAHTEDLRSICADRKLCSATDRTQPLLCLGWKDKGIIHNHPRIWSIHILILCESSQNVFVVSEEKSRKFGEHYANAWDYYPSHSHFHWTLIPLTLRKWMKMNPFGKVPCLLYFQGIRSARINCILVRLEYVCGSRECLWNCNGYFGTARTG